MSSRFSHDTCSSKSQTQNWKAFPSPFLFLSLSQSLAEAVAAATSGQKPAEISSFSQALAKSVGQIYISGKPTQTKMVVLATLCVRGKKMQ